MRVADFRGGAKREGLVSYFMLGGGMGRGLSATVIRSVMLISDSESILEGGVFGSKCPGRVRVAAGASGNARW